VVPDRASLISLAYRAMGGVPRPIVRRAFQLSAFDKLVTKPFVQIAKLDDTDFLAQLEAVDRFTRNMIAYPGRTFGQLYHRMVKGNELAAGKVHFEGRDVDFADIRVPVLSFGGATDTIAPVSCVRPITGLVPNAPEMRFEVVPGGHLGMLTGRRARSTTWLIMDDFIDQHSSDRGRRTSAGSTTGKASAKKTRSTGTSSGKGRAARSGGTRRTAAQTQEPGEPLIGANKQRRFTSSSSRSLAGGRPRRDAG
jgi:polyhydroxyalkanoate synthase subunit PhaC